MTLALHADARIHRAMQSVADPLRIVSICGWCPDVERRTAAVQQTGAEVSHSMCPACVKKCEQQMIEWVTRVA